MDANKMTITRALVELKTLDDRITKKINGTVFISIKGEFHKPVQGINDAVPNYQSITDLIERRTKIKSAIVSSNALTQVTICGKNFTVAEAIETKSSIKHLKTLLASMKTQYGTAVNAVEQMNSRVRKDLEAKSSRESEKDKSTQMTLEDFSQTYVKLHGVELCDPLNVSKKIEQLEQYIAQFTQEVDYILSEKNAVTYVSI